MQLFSRLAAPVLAVVLVSACSAPGLASSDAATADPPAARLMTVYRSPDCSCCHEWVAIAKAAGWQVETVNVTDMADLKVKTGVPQDAFSCHTTLVGGYFVEGHVPLSAVDRLVTERPSIDGIALPGMPAGSPGMGGVQHGRLQVVSVSDGQISPFGSY